jgi:hypothetical protein
MSLNMESELMDEWLKLCDHKYKDLVRAREILLLHYPPFLKEWAQCFNPKNSEADKKERIYEAINTFIDRWVVSLNIEKLLREENLIPPFEEGVSEAAFKVKPSGSNLADGAWLNNRPPDSMIFQINIDAPIEAIANVIEREIVALKKQKQKKKDPINIDKADLAIWIAYVNGYSAHDQNVIELYRKYKSDYESTDINIADRLRKKETGRFAKLRQLADPENHGKDWHPGRDLEFLIKR